jgi:hypothetical protein
MLFPSLAFATLQLVPDNVNTNANSNLNANTQGQAQGQGQLQGQLQGQAQSTIVSSRIDNDVRNNALSYAGSAAVAGGSASGASINVEVPRMMGAIGLGSLYPTAPCMGTSNIGGGNGFFTFGAGTSWTDDECGIRETSRSFSGLGKGEDALKVLCTSKYAAAAPSCAQPVKE